VKGKVARYDLGGIDPIAHSGGYAEEAITFDLRGTALTPRGIIAIAAKVLGK